MAMFGSMGTAAPATQQDAAYQPGKFDIFMQSLLGQQSPADAAEHLRELHYQQSMRPIQQQALQRWMGLFGNVGAAAPAAAPAQTPDASAAGTGDAFGDGIGRAISLLAPPAAAAPASQPAPQPVAQPAGQAGQSAGGLDINDPMTQQILFGGAAFQMPGAKEALDIAKAVQPEIHYDRGFGYNQKTGAAAGGYHPDLDKGQEPLFDQYGRLIGVRNMAGAVQSAADMAGAVSGAQEGAKAAYDLVQVPQSDGSTRMVPRLQAAEMLAGRGRAGGVPGPGGAAPANGGGAFGVSQTPADAKLQSERATNQAQRENQQPKAYTGLADQGRASDLVIDTIDRALSQIGDGTAGMGSVLAGVPGTKAHDLQSTLNTIRANVGFDKLQSMRENSPTGGALGQVSEQENKLLQSVLGAIDQSQSSDQLRANLQTLRGQLAQIRAQRQQLYNAQYGNAGGGPGAAGAPSRAEIEAEMRRRRLLR